MTTTTTYPASEKQISLIQRLLGEKMYDGQTLLAEIADGTLTKRTASFHIDMLFASPRKPLADSEKAKPGYYVRTEQDGQDPDGGRAVYVVVENKAKTNTYAKRLEISGAGRASWVYAPGVGRSLAAEGLEPLTVDEAAQMGKLYGVCVVCARTLTDPASVERGIGPVCAKRLH